MPVLQAGRPLEARLGEEVELVAHVRRADQNDPVERVDATAEGVSEGVRPRRRVVGEGPGPTRGVASPRRGVQRAGISAEDGQQRRVARSVAVPTSPAAGAHLLRVERRVSVFVSEWFVDLLSLTVTVDVRLLSTAI